MAFTNRISQFLTKIAFGASPRLYGRFSSGAGVGEEIGIGSGLELAGGVLKVVECISRTRAEGYPGTTVRRKIVLNSWADLPGDLAGMLVYLAAENTYINPYSNYVLNGSSGYSITITLARESYLDGHRFRLTIIRDGTSTGEWVSVLDSITAPLYAVGGSGADATASAVVKTVSVSATELNPEVPGRICIVDKEIFISRTSSGSWSQLLSIIP